MNQWFAKLPHSEPPGNSGSSYFPAKRGEPGSACLSGASLARSLHGDQGASQRFWSIFWTHVEPKSQDLNLYYAIWIDLRMQIHQIPMFNPKPRMQISTFLFNLDIWYKYKENKTYQDFSRLSSFPIWANNHEKPRVKSRGLRCRRKQTQQCATSRYRACKRD